MEVGLKWWETVGPYLEDEEPQSYRQLAVLPHDLEDADGFRRKDVKGLDHLWRRWLAGKQPEGAPFVDRATQPVHTKVCSNDK